MRADPIGPLLLGDETGMPLRLAQRSAMAAVLLTLGLELSGCDALDPTGLFAEKYEAKVIPDTPPNQLYSEGLAAIEDRNFEALMASSYFWPS